MAVRGGRQIMIGSRLTTATSD